MYFLEFLGDKVKVDPYDPSSTSPTEIIIVVIYKIKFTIISGFKGAGGGPVVLDNELNCDFSDSCCWRNEEPPTDKLDWGLGSGEIDDAKFQNSFQTSDKPCK